MIQKPTAPFLTWRRWGISGIGLVVASVVVGIVISVLVDEDRGWAAGGLAFGLAALIKIAWPLRNEAWFRATVAAFATLDIATIIGIDWSTTHSWSGSAFGGFLRLNLIVMMAIVYGIYRLKYGTPAQEFAESPDDAPNYSQRDLEL
jgi:hypothetical protein